MSHKCHQLADILLRIEAEMRINSLWANETPSFHALDSIQPFCIDTLSFQQWLQFVFLPKMKRVLEEGLQFPSSCDIAPMASESFKQNIEQTDTLLELLIECDQISSY